MFPYTPLDQIRPPGCTLSTPAACNPTHQNTSSWKRQVRIDHAHGTKPREEGFNLSILFLCFMANPKFLLSSGDGKAVLVHIWVNKAKLKCLEPTLKWITHCGIVSRKQVWPINMKCSSGSCHLTWQMWTPRTWEGKWFYLKSHGEEREDDSPRLLVLSDSFLLHQLCTCHLNVREPFWKIE